jgi:hypothetical protein
LIVEDYQLPPHLYYFLYYTTAVMEKDTLPSYNIVE